MDTQDSSVVDVPNLKLAKVGKDREKKRGGAGWLGARGAGSGFSGALGGAGAGAGGGVMGTGMSLAKILSILLVSGGLSAGAWQVGNMMAGSSAAANGSAAPKVFADKDSQKYADTSGVIKGQNTIPNSLGYINNDGLTDEQRAAKKAAEDAAAAKAAADAKAAAEADAKAKELADAKAASAASDPKAVAAAPQTPRIGLGGTGKLGAMRSSFGGGGGGGLSGGSGLSGGINRSFGADGMGGKGQNGALSAFRAPTKAAATSVSSPTRSKSNSKGFAKQQLDNANGASRTALGSGKTETASVGSGVPFDNPNNAGTVISGPGVGSGGVSGPADTGGTTDPSNGGGGTASGPVSSGAACPDANYEPDINGNCVSQTATPSAQNAAPYQGLLDAVMVMLGIVMILSIIAMAVKNVPPYGTGLALWLCGLACALGATIAAMGIAIATMKHGDFMIGAIVGVVGGFITAAAAVSFGHATSAIPAMLQPAGVLIASAVGELAAMSSKSKAASMQ